MRLKLCLAQPGQTPRDIVVTCDVTTTVAALATELVKCALVHDASLCETASSGLVPLTLQGRPPGGLQDYLLDPATPLALSGVRSGWEVALVPEAASRAPRLLPTVGSATVLNGPQQGVEFSLLAGENTIGRESGNRVCLRDPSVSRRHAVLTIGEDVTVRDLGSGNGTLIEQPDNARAANNTRSIAAADLAEFVISLGKIRVRVRLYPELLTPGDITRPEAPAWQLVHTRAPSFSKQLQETTVQLPKPELTPKPQSIPKLALIAPIVMGGVMYAATQNALTLTMVALSPLMLIGSWLDGRSASRKQAKLAAANFHDLLATAELKIQKLQETERAVLEAQHLDPPAITKIIGTRTNALWQRKPGTHSFLEISLGHAEQPSNITITVPTSEGSEPVLWQQTQALARKYANLPNAAYTLKLSEHHALALTGHNQDITAHARTLLLQLAALHSPEELKIIAVCETGAAQPEWDWLKWLPHCDPPPATGTTDAILGNLEDKLNSAKTNRGGASAQPALPATLLIIAPHQATSSAYSRLLNIVEHGHKAGIYTLWLAPHKQDPTRNTAAQPVIAAGCEAILTLGRDNTATLQHANTATETHITLPHPLTQTQAETLAKQLSPVIDAAALHTTTQALPASVDLATMHPSDLIADETTISHLWHQTGSLNSNWQPGSARQPIQLTALVGQTATDPLTIDLRKEGPHALVGGTTGAGKSEFLQTWIMSLAATISPDRLTFLLIDYKGGSAFAECANLPHTVGLVTDLNQQLVHRALISLKAEIRRREEILLATGAKDLQTMEAASDPTAPPALVIVVDEFAALAAEIPEFVDGMIDIAQRGRSLGLHLIMATQRPAGVIKENLRANTNLRIALRMADAADSRDVLRSDAAAHISTQQPGRGFITSGNGGMREFQAAYLGRDSRRSGGESSLKIAGFSLCEEELLRPHGWIAERVSAEVVPDIRRLCRSINAAATSHALKQPRKPWLPPLPQVISSESLLQQADRARDERPSERPAAPLGLVDLPAQQAQPVAWLQLVDVANVMFYGAVGSGKTSALLHLVVALSAPDCGIDTWFYAVDGGGGALAVLADLPNVGAVVEGSDAEHLESVISMLTQELKKRQSPGADTACPRLVLLLDGLSTILTERLQYSAQGTKLLQQLAMLMQQGSTVGIHVIGTSVRPGVLPSQLAAAVGAQYVLKQTQASNYDLLGVDRAALASAPAGRCIHAATGALIQLASPGAKRDWGEALARVAQLRRGQGVPAALKVERMPQEPALQSIPAPQSGAPLAQLGQLGQLG